MACRTPRGAEPRKARTKAEPVFQPRREELARYGSLIELLHSQGRIKPGTPREEILLKGLAALADANAPVPRGTGATNTHIHIQKDEASGQAIILTQPGLKKLSRAELEAAECDAVITEPGKRNRSTIPLSVRRAVLARDRHRCRAPGRGDAHFPRDSPHRGAQTGRHKRSGKPRYALRSMPSTIS